MADHIDVLGKLAKTPLDVDNNLKVVGADDTIYNFTGDTYSAFYSSLKNLYYKLKEIDLELRQYIDSEQDKRSIDSVSSLILSILKFVNDMNGKESVEIEKDKKQFTQQHIDLKPGYGKHTDSYLKKLETVLHRKDGTDKFRSFLDVYESLKNSHLYSMINGGKLDELNETLEKAKENQKIVKKQISDITKQQKELTKEEKAVEAKKEVVESDGFEKGTDGLKKILDTQKEDYLSKISIIDTKIDKLQTYLGALLVLILLKFFFGSPICNLLNKLIGFIPSEGLQISCDLGMGMGFFVLYSAIGTLSILSVLFYLLKIQYDQLFASKNYITYIDNKLIAIESMRKLYSLKDDEYSKELNKVIVEQGFTSVFEMGQQTLLGKAQDNAFIADIAKEVIKKGVGGS